MFCIRQKEGKGGGSDMNRLICLIICLSIAFLIAGCIQIQNDQPTTTPEAISSPTPARTETVAPTETPTGSEEFQSLEVHSGEDVMRNVHEGSSSIELKGTVVRSYNGSLGEEVVWEHEFWMKKNGAYKYRMEYDNYTMTSNGSVTVFVAPPMSTVGVMSKTFNELNESEKIWINAPKEDLYWWIDLITPREPVPHLSGEEEVAGRDCYVIEMYWGQVNESEEPYSKLWIDKEYWYPLKVQFDTIVYYESIEFNPRIDDSKFEYQIPQDVPEDVDEICYCEDRSDYRQGLVDCTCEELGG